ncbi:hypothetical protein ACWKWU_09190 [Chitinophaga lutea]
METSFYCVASKLMSGLPGLTGGRPGEPLDMADLFGMLPYFAVPMLIVLIGGLFAISQYQSRLKP